MNAKFSRAVKNGEVVHVSSLNETTDKGLACNCTCVECGKVVQFVTRRIPTTTKFFRHDKRSSCGGGIMTALHRAAQQILVRNKKFKVCSGDVLYENPQLETQLGNFRADVLANSNDGTPLVFEVVVNCDLTDSKISYLREQKITSIRFDLGAVSSKISDQELEDLIINDVQIKRFIFPDLPANKPQLLEQPSKSVLANAGNSTGILVVIGLAILAGWAWLSNRSSKPKTPRKHPKSR